jgi:hypothetical protein
VIPALIDLHVRPLRTESGDLDTLHIAERARDRGLDGIAVIGRDEVVATDAAAATATGVEVFVGVELATDRGLLLCYPRAADDWFRGAGWRSAAQTDGVYVADAVVKAFADRGGAVIAVPAADVQPAAGVHGLLVAESTLDEQAVDAAWGARLTCVGGSGTGVDGEHFGSVATVFASPPTGQETLVDGLRSGRAWPVEIGTPELAELTRASQAARPAAAPARGSNEPGRGSNEPTRGYHEAVDLRTQPRATGRDTAPAVREPPTGTVQRPRPRLDPQERPGDNRGNRLNRDEVRRIADIALEDGQPTFDPVAVMYGLDARKVHRFAHKTDDELDRVNGNRARGPETNVMLMPSFDELRQERQRINLLFARTEEESQLEDSISLRFALSHFGDDEDALADLPAAPTARRRHKRRR